MKRKFSLSIKANIFISIFALTLVLIIALWSLQVFFFDVIYKTSKKNDIERATTLISSNLEGSVLDYNGTAKLSSFAKQISLEYELCVKIYNCSQGYTELTSTDCTDDACFLHKLNDRALLLSWLTSATNEDTFTNVIEKGDFDSYILNGFSGDASDTLVSVTTASDDSGTLYLIVLSSVAEPAQALVSVFRAMLGFVSLFLVITAVVISLVLASRISKPIVSMSRDAKRLAQADYEVEFVEKGPKEITELAKTLNYTAGELGKLDSMQKELIANISHDLRTPLTMISGYAEMMRDIPSENTPENLQIIIDETSRLTSLVNDMLSVSRLQAGTQKMDIRRVNLTNAVFQTVERYARFKEHNDFVINFEYDDTVFIMADEIRLLQVIYNLINNAINYTGVDRTVTVKQTIENDIVRISVCDTGDGIKEEDLPLIWDRYYKVDKIHRRAVVGTGLGLSIVKNILLAHGSRFGVSSELKKGSIFWFEFKIVE